MNFRFDALVPFARNFLLKPAVCAVAAAAAAWAQPADEGIIKVVAGTPFLGDGGPAAQAILDGPEDVAVDGAGNLYILDSLHDRIRKVDAAGVITTVAGNGAEWFIDHSRGDGGPAVQAQLDLYFAHGGVAVDRVGNLYITDRSRIRKVDAAGVITTVVGHRSRDGFNGDGAAVGALLNDPRGIAVDGAGNLYIADMGNHRIRKVDAAGMITTVAGTGRASHGGDGGPAVRAHLDEPADVAVDGSGNLYIADRGNQRIRKVDAAGVITTVAGTGEQADLSFARDAHGDGGPAVRAPLNRPSDVAVDGSGNLYIATSRRIRKVDAAGVITTVAGTGERDDGGDGGPAAQAILDQPEGMAVDGAGNLYIADRGNHSIRKVDAMGVITTVAGRRGHRLCGQCPLPNAGDGGAAVGALLGRPEGVAVDGSGNVYIADTRNGRIRKVDTAGVITTVAGGGEESYWSSGIPAVQTRLINPRGVAVDGLGNLYITEMGGSAHIHKVDAAGVITTVATVGRYRAEGIAVDGSGNVYIAEKLYDRVSKVDAAGVITTVAGTGESGFGGDGGPAVQAQLDGPEGVAVDGLGNVFIADGYNRRIRKVDAAGVITTVVEDISVDDVAVDGSGNLYIATSTRIYKVDTAGVIVSMAGTGESGYGGYGGPAVRAQLNSPGGVAVDGAGNVFIADTGNHLILRVRPPAFSPPPNISRSIRLSPNALISVFGQDFAGTQTLSPVLDDAGRIAVNLADTCLEIGGRRAPLFFVSPTQINAQAPHDLTPLEKGVRAAVVRDCGTVKEQRDWTNVSIDAVTPRFFTFVNNPDRRDPLAAVHGGGPGLVGAPGLLPGAEFTPAAPGEVVTLYGTGFGPVEPPLEAGEIPGATADLVYSVSFYVGVPVPPYVGGTVPPQDVLYAGAAPCCAGLYQFTLRLPADLPDGDAQVYATVRGSFEGERHTRAGTFLTVRRQQ